MNYRVLACDDVHEEAIRILEPIAQVDQKGKQSEAELLATIHEYDAILIRSETKMTATVMAKANKLKIIARAGVGVDNIDVPAATQKGIIVVNSPEGNTIAAAEQTLTLMLGLSRYVGPADAALKNGQWRRKDFMGTELYHKTLGVIGLGKIGSHVAKVAKTMGMRVLAFDPFVTHDRAAQLGVELLSLDEIFGQADYLTLHVPKTPETHHMINRETLATMKEGVRIINCARGELIDEAALVEALQSGKVAGAALDVFAKEPLENSPLQQMGAKVLLTPHLGASTAEAQVNVAIDVAEQVYAVLTGGHARSAINIPSMAPQLLRDIQSYFYLAEKLGRFLGQILDKPIKRVAITYNGELASKNTEPLKVAVLHGLLKPILNDSINYVNALLQAKERDITVSETKSEEPLDYANRLEIQVTTEQETSAIAGTLIGEQEERIIMIDQFPISCTPKGYLLVIPHPDKPGMVGHIGDLLGHNDVNISGIQLGRHAIRGPAVMVVNIDEPIAPALLTQIRNCPEFKATRLISLD